MPEKIELTHEYEIYPSLGDFSAEDQNVIKESLEATKRSYAPYSNFNVGAALLLEDGTIIHGANQENGAYPEGCCAEKVAFFKASTLADRKKIKKLAVTAVHGHEHVAATPCGGCRQVMLEFETLQNEDIELIMLLAPGKWVKTKNIKSLLPFSFKL